MENKARIETLDSFRAIAIVMVLLYHFYSRWTPPIGTVDYYPYHNTLSSYFKFGYFGVHFFFVISGFVIFYTLEKSKTLKEFLIKRFIRLFPPLLLCSIITYFFVQACDSQNHFAEFHSTTPLNFLPSLTFTNPLFWAKLFHRNDIANISGSYWSLWVEATFYVLSSVIFFMKKDKFVANWMLLLFPATILKVIGMQQPGFVFSGIPQLNFIFRILKASSVYFNICNFFIYFSLGILFNCLFFKKKISSFSKYVCIFFAITELYLLSENGLRLLFLAVILAFLLFIYKPRCLAFINNALIVRIGIISYTVYLIHEYLGVMLINKVAGFIHQDILIRLTPMLVITVFIVFAEIMYRVYEKPATSFLKKTLIVKTPR